MIIRDEHPADFCAISTLNEAAFGRPDEARLVDRLRADGDLIASLVAEDRGKVVGYVALSRMGVPFRALGLGPVATAANRRREGIAGRLIREALARAAAGEWQAVFVVGAPDYYRRFGFDAAAAEGFSSSYAGPFLMALSLGGVMPTATGRIEYAAAFAGL